MLRHLLGRPPTKLSKRIKFQKIYYQKLFKRRFLFKEMEILRKLSIIDF